ncbi:MAG: flagellar motor switch protein FliG [Alphaproteobacteria bacterium CG11_big_fil_rev_8_21_14_0_20_39_49]|nr:MAG: flagellar motor switch protein FliG [Alphaproteobacteria bacterium CG11_big_fil_rev_8_21_14_0_20_39_49]
MANIDNYAKLSGLEKASIVLMSVNESNATKIFSIMHDDEIKEISHCMSGLGTVSAEVVEQLFFDFSNSVSETLSFVGNLDNTEKLLAKALGKERVDGIMEDIRGPAGRNTWDKLGNVSEEILASYLKTEYPQTVALIVSKLKPAHSARVLAMLPEDFTFEVMLRMLEMDNVKKEVLDNVEKALRAEFISTVSKTQKLDNDEMMAEIFNNFDRTSEAKFMGMLEDNSPEAAEKIKNLMFTFEDLIKTDAQGIQALLRVADKTKLTVALKGASEEVRDLFVKNMSARASKIMLDEMESMGPVRLRDVDEAQSEIIIQAKDLINSGEMNLAQGDGDEDELVY